MEGLGGESARTGSAYETDRDATRARLSATAEQLRVDLGAALVLVFQTAATVRTALEELLRAERVTDSARVESESAAFSGLDGGADSLAAVLFVDVADPVALGDRLAELPGVAQRVFLDIGGARVSAAPGGDDGSGAFHLRFQLDGSQRAALLDGASVVVGVDHPACHATAPVSAEQVRAAVADLRR